MILTNANIVLNNEVVLGSLKIEDGKIQAIDTGKMALASAVDCQGGYLMPGLVELHTDTFSGGSLHQFLREVWGISLKRGTTRLRARMPTLDECTRLNISRGIPVMEVHTHNHCRDTGMLREYSIARSRSDLFEYSVEPKA